MNNTLQHNQKYKLLEHESLVVNDTTLYRIIAIRSFGDVVIGDKGGFIEKESNLSHNDNAWVYGDARVYDNARVSDNARVYDNAWVFGNAQVSDNAWVSGDARFFGDAWVYDNARVFGNARVFDNAWVSGNAQVYGNARVFDNTCVSDNARVLGDMSPHNNTGDGSTKDTNPKDSLGTKKWRQYCTVPTTIIWELGVAMLEGARKYGRHNYRKAGIRASVYVDAAKGHIDQWWEGEDIDSDSGLNHLVKAAACLAVLRDAQVNDMCKDDRPPKMKLDGLRDNLQKAVEKIIEKYPTCKPPFTEANCD